MRDIEAWDSKHAVTLSIGPGEDSRIYSTSDGGKTWKERFRNTDPAAFYDCMAFSRNGRGLAMSDPVDGYFQIAQTNDFGRTWSVRSHDGMPPALDGEFGFAASGTCLVAGPFRNFWFVTGGVDTPADLPIPRTADAVGRSRTYPCVAARRRASTRWTSAPQARAWLVGGAFDAETDEQRPASPYLSYPSGAELVGEP